MVWMPAMAESERFAAVASICGTDIYWYGEVLVNKPVYMYHVECDEIVPVTESVNMLNSINKRGGNAQLKMCYGVGHNAWDIAYDGDELMNWMLVQRKN